MNKKFVTLYRHIIEQERKYPEATGELSDLLADIALACKLISLEVNRAGLIDILGFSGTENVHGEQVKKLDEFASSLARQGKLIRPSDGFTVADVLPLLEGMHKSEREPYFKARLANVLEDSGGHEEDLAPEIAQILEMGLSAFDTYIEVIIAHRGDFHRRYLVECLDALCMKNRPGTLITQPRVKNAPRRFILDSRLLEVLLQIAVRVLPTSPRESRFSIAYSHP